MSGEQLTALLEIPISHAQGTPAETDVVHLESNGRVAQQSLSAMTEKNGALAGGHIATISGPYLFDGFRPALVVNGNGCGHGYRADDAYPHRASACWVQPRDRFPRPAGVGVLAVSDANRGVGSRSCSPRP